MMSKDGTDMRSDGGIWQVSDFAFGAYHGYWGTLLPTKQIL